MSKVENGAKAATAPKSKYAAKRQARLEQARQEEKQVLVEEPNIDDLSRPVFSVP